MPAKEIKELRQSGRLDEALIMAKSELQADPENIWPKRNLSWVYYELLKQNASPEHFNEFIKWLSEIKELNLPPEEKMLFDNTAWQIGKIVFALAKQEHVELQKCVRIFELIQNFHFTKPSEAWSFLFKAFHKAFKDSDKYIVFSDWWNLKNLRAEDFQKEKMPNGREVMSIAEQGYITYARHMLPKTTQMGETIFDREKAMAFLPAIRQISESHPQMQFPPYFVAKLMIALGDKNNVFESLMPFARKKRGDFWVWQILAEVFSNDSDKVFACYCKALTCKSPEEMLVGIRQKLASILISKKLYNEAKTEIETLVKVRTEHEFKIPVEVTSWQNQEWYQAATPAKNNQQLYQHHTFAADSLLFSDLTEEPIIVDFVNTEKKILNFIASEKKFGFFKYDRFLKDVKVGDILKVRFQDGTIGGHYQAYTVTKTEDEDFKKQNLKEIEGLVKIPVGKPFGFLDQVYIHPTTVSKMKLTDGMHIKAKAIKTYNQEKKQWSWKLI